MNILNQMTSPFKEHTPIRLAAHFEVSQHQLQSIFSYLVPMLEDAVTRLTLSPQGLARLLAQLVSKQYRQDLEAHDLFQNSRILANGTGLLSLLLHNEASIRVHSCVVAEGAHVDATLVRQMMPYIALHFISALAARTNGPLCELAERCADHVPAREHAPYRLAELVHSVHDRKKKSMFARKSHGSIKDVLNTLARIDSEEELGQLQY